LHDSQIFPHLSRGVGFNLTNPTCLFFKADSSTTLPSYFCNLNRQNTEQINLVSPEVITLVDNHVDYARRNISGSSPVKTDSYTDNGIMYQSVRSVEERRETKNPINFELDNESFFKRVIGLYIFVNLLIVISILFIKTINTMAGRL
jgi:hypothetical protein